MELNENIYRLKELMGILKEDKDKQYEEEKDCYPYDYEPGKKYGRDELSKLFSCFAGESNFPIEAVKEMIFPLLPPNDENPNHYFMDLDPKNIQVGPDEFVTMEEKVENYKNKYSKISLETIYLTPDQIHPDTMKFIPNKESVKGGKERIEVQMNRALKDGIETLTANEPFVVEIVGGMYKWLEGWNRLIALMKLYEQGKISEIKGKSFVAHPA
jgi:hypothetical protein